MTQPSVLLTYGWCRVSYVILHSLARRGVPVHVGDCSRLAMCRFSRLRASFVRYRNPYRDPSGFVTDLLQAIERTGAAVLIAGHEDILPIAREKYRFPSEVRVPVSDAAAIEAVANKWTLITLARGCGITVPETYKPDSWSELDHYLSDVQYPAVVKSQVGNSAKGMFIVADAAGAMRRFAQLVSDYRLAVARWPVVQAFTPGEAYGVCLLYNRGELRASFCERYLRCKDGNIGTSVFRESAAAPELVDLATTLLRPFMWHGPVHLDFLYDVRAKRAALLEVNPRFWGALDLAVRAGVDFPWLLYRMAVDGDVAPVTTYPLGVRSRWIAGELLHLLNHARRGRLGEATRSLALVARQRADGFDDFRLADPVPLVGELLYYGTRFAATRSTNPVEEGMIA